MIIYIWIYIYMIIYIYTYDYIYTWLYIYIYTYDYIYIYMIIYIYVIIYIYIYIIHCILLYIELAAAMITFGVNSWSLLILRPKQVGHQEKVTASQRSTGHERWELEIVSRTTRLHRTGLPAGASGPCGGEDVGQHYLLESDQLWRPPVMIVVL